MSRVILLVHVLDRVLSFPSLAILTGLPAEVLAGLALLRETMKHMRPHAAFN